MRLAAYAGASTALAAGVVVYAFNQRSNFYSACVYLAQSNLCLMILTNLILFVVAAGMYGLQRCFYGPLRPIEIEQLYEKAWFAITETCLAMTIFREEVGAWFLVMFVALLAGKVWGWIGEGRVEILEQQPPANPRLFHIRLSLSLGLSLVYDAWLMWYTVHTVIQQARPNMMVMFLFEFAVLTTSSLSTALRYCISLVEQSILKAQMKERLAARKREVRAEREEILRQRAAASAAVSEGETPVETSQAPLPSEDDVDEMDIEVPGWDGKGQWVLSLDLATDFFKLLIYSSFFFILLTFYGLPLHIMRDLLLTARSFVKRLAAFIKYRRATRDMNTRYADATAEEIQREDTCIICREEMRPWAETNPAPVEGAPVVRPATTINERSRPKKLPCGHVLHLGCLKSWLERQQVCPTCRRPVVDGTATTPARPGHALPAPGAPGAGPNPGAANGPQPPAARPNNMRVFGFGPFRLAFGQGNVRDLAQNLNENQAGGAAGGGPQRLFGMEFERVPARREPERYDARANAAAQQANVAVELMLLEQRIQNEIRELQINQQELHLVNMLQQELSRLRSMQNLAGVPDQSSPPPNAQISFQTEASGRTPSRTISPHRDGQARTTASVFAPFTGLPTVPVQRHSVRHGASAIPAGSSDLPPGVTLPEGWSLLPLERLDNPVAPPAPSPAFPHLPFQNFMPATGGFMPVPMPMARGVSTPGHATPGISHSGPTSQAVPTLVPGVTQTVTFAPNFIPTPSAPANPTTNTATGNDTAPASAVPSTSEVGATNPGRTTDGASAQHTQLGGAHPIPHSTDSPSHFTLNPPTSTPSDPDGINSIFSRSFNFPSDAAQVESSASTPIPVGIPDATSTNAAQDSEVSSTPSSNRMNDSNVSTTAVNPVSISMTTPSTTNAETESGSSTQTDMESSRGHDKGKAKAVTVEDEPSDEA